MKHINNLFIAVLLQLSIIAGFTSYSQTFDFVKKSKAELLNKNEAQMPTPEDLQATALMLSRYYKSNTVQIPFVDRSCGDKILLERIKTLHNDVSELCQKAIEFNNLNVYYTEQGDVPIFITGERLKSLSQKYKTRTLSNLVAIDFISDNRSLFRLQNPDVELKPSETIVDNEGKKHIRFSQFYEGVPVWGKELIVHFDAENQIYLINGRYVPTPLGIDVKSEKVKSDDAIRIAMQNLSKTVNILDLESSIKDLLKYRGPKAEKYIWIEPKTRKPVLAWVIEIRPNIVDNWRYFIDVERGEILEKYNASPSDGPTTAVAKDAFGNNRTINVYLEAGNYYMIDASRPMYNNNPQNPKGVIMTMTNNNTDLTKQSKPNVFSSTNNQWNDAFSVSAHYNTGLVYEYYRTTHNRNSIDGQGMSMITMLHVTDGGQSLDNAYWNGQFVVMGDGGDATSGWPPALDFLAHEFTHGVVTFTVDFEYKFQSGALNEAFADWGGCMVDREDWYMGEDIVKLSAFPTGRLRDLSDPHNGGTKGDDSWLPAHMNEYLDLDIDEDNGGVHYNVGIINKATYLIGNSIGKDKLEKIYYRVLNNRYLSKQAQFIDMRLACVKAAEELFGANSNEVATVKSAFDRVGILDGSGTNPDPDLTPVNGPSWIAYVATADLALYLAKPVIQNPYVDVKKLTSTVVYTQNNGVITVPDNGSVIFFIDNNNFVRGIRNDGTNETVLSQTGIWRTIAISPDGLKLAATTTSLNPIVYVFDLEQGTYKEITLYVPNTGGDSSIVPLFANTLSWNINNKILAYDALNYGFDKDGKEYFYMEMNAIDVPSGVIYRIFPPMPPGVHIGSPDFSKNSTYKLVFEVYNESEGMYYINGVDLFSGKVNNIVYSEESVASLSSPVYSPTDTRLAFQAYFPGQQIYSINQIQLASDKISAAGEVEGYLSNAGLPKWFAVGNRPVSVDYENNTSSSLIISPNPFQSYTSVSYYLEQNCSTEISIYNIQGIRVRTLKSAGFESAGYHSINWDGNNDKGVPLPSGIYCVMKKEIQGNGNSKTEYRLIHLLK